MWRMSIHLNDFPLSHRSLSRTGANKDTKTICLEQSPKKSLVAEMIGW